MFTPEQRHSVLTHWSATLQSSADASLTRDRLALSESFRTTPIGSGFSGGAVFRVQYAGSVEAVSKAESQPPSWALKAWPSSASSPQIMRIAAIVRAAAQHSSLLAPPLTRGDADSTLVSEHGHFWEVARWIPGAPLPSDASETAVARGGEAIASIHAALNPDRWSTSRPVPKDREIPRCITDRSTRLQEITSQIHRIALELPAQDELASRLACQLTREQPHEPASAFHCRELARLLIQSAAALARQWSDVSPQLVERLHQHGRDRGRLPTCWVLRDVHREHVLFNDSEVVQGILDYDALDLDSPAADLARWAGDFDATAPSIAKATGPIACSRLDAAVAGYRRIRPFSQSEWDLAQTLIDVNQVGGLANWLVWLIAERRQFAASAQQVQGRISHLIASNC